MIKYLESLNNKQKEACIDTDGPSLIIAGAGSGKTKVLTSRIAYLINEKKVPASFILAITFTNKAAREMKERLYKVVGSDTNYVTCLTFHSFCARFLRNEIMILPNRKRSFQIIDDDETETMVKTAMIDLNYDIKLVKPSEIATSISSIKAKIKTFNDYDDYYREKLEAIMNKYNEELIANNLVDFDDLILLTMQILESHKDILDRYQNIYKYILVDEFQDTSNIQYDLISLLAGKDKNVFIVGDEDQSIYSFRGANVGNISKFMKDFPDFHKHILDENYRSTTNILDSANTLIKHNKKRIPKDLWTSKEGGEEVSLYYYDSDRAESRAVVSTIEKLVKTGNYKYSDCAILYRNNFLSRNFENELIQEKVPYKIYSGLSFYKRKEVKDMMAYLRLALNPDDFYSFKRVVNSPRRGIGDTTLLKISKFIDNKGYTLTEAIDSVELSKNTKETIINFKKMILDLRSSLNDSNIKEFFNLVYEKTGYKHYIEQIEDPDEQTQREENIKELFSAINEGELIGSTEEVLGDFLQNVSLLTDTDIESSNPDHVSLMTMHSAKGLEFKVVFAVCLEADIIPSPKQFDPLNEEEERRLLYVAMTRAKERLYLSCATSRFKFGAMNNTAPSKFIAEINIEPKTERDNVNRTFHSTKTNVGEVVKGEFDVGDKVVHDIYGKGVILGEIEGFYIVQFTSLNARKKIIVNHPFLKKDNE